MKAVIALLAVIATASAGIVAPVALHAPTVISRAPAFDSAVIKSDRVGGNFAYSVAENHAFAAHTPVISHVTSPVAVSYAAGAPIVSYSAPAVHAAVAPIGHLGYAAGPLALGHSAIRVL